ncbi:MAG: hypothetical protein U0270_01940 [Labilithrix sp.]
MNIDRKQALAAIAAGLVAFLPRLGKAAPTPPTVPITPVLPPPVDAAAIEDLKRRVAALEAALAAQVAFTKEANGNLTLRTNGSVAFHVGGAMSVAASGQMVLKGATINLN